MSCVSRKLAVIGSVLMMVAPGFGQYYPGQSFSAGQTPASARQTPMPMYGQQPVMVPQYPAQQRQQPAAPAQQRQQTAPPQGSMYNMQPRTATPSTSTRPAASSTNSQSSRAASTPRPARNADKPAASSASTNSSTEETRSTPAPAVATETKTTPAPVAETKSTPEPESTASAAVVPDSTDKLVFMNRRTGKKLVALTYDDGPNPSLTPKLIEWLKANDVPATFFLQGKMVKTYPDLTRKVAEMGFELANHSYSHPDLRKRSEEQVLNELQDTHDIIKEVTGVDVKLMRPPYGAHNAKVDDVCRRLGYKIINWDVDTNDWRGRSADAMLKDIMSMTGDGSIILMHDRKHRGRESVLEVTQKAVEQLRAKGYRFVTVGELLDMTPATIATASPAPAAESDPAPAATTVEPTAAGAAPATEAVSASVAVTDEATTSAAAGDSGTIFPQ